jgi:hypothetical protein
MAMPDSLIWQIPKVILETIVHRKKRLRRIARKAPMVMSGSDTVHVKNPMKYVAIDRLDRLILLDLQVLIKSERSYTVHIRK